jgi:hypothetical protein
LEVRTIRTSTALAGSNRMPGLAQVAEIRSHVTILKTGAVRDQVRYVFTSLTPEQANADRLLTLSRGHWQIENACFHVKDDSFGEDRHVLQRHQRGEVVSLLRGTALNLSCRVLTDLSGRFDRVVIEVEVADLAASERVQAVLFGLPAFQQAAADPHRLIEKGASEFWTVVAESGRA